MIHTTQETIFEADIADVEYVGATVDGTWYPLDFAEIVLRVSVEHHVMHDKTVGGTLVWQERGPSASHLQEQYEVPEPLDVVVETPDRRAVLDDTFLVSHKKGSFIAKDVTIHYNNE